ncbi:hypothetical protein JRQ81_007801 [Phrynocephalus forsythii]|uniref:Scavenger receptor class B member 1 n=1 Tax=Phrynocephalus forsythii TaxID=171643 RepID=A0A9Q0XFM5_9SAUR|nr:hypothetical protein JRQ81_007801 [Phrynocephalus forsythii]
MGGGDDGRRCCNNNNNNAFRAAVGLGIAGFGCLVFGVLLIVLMPIIMKEQVTKVSYWRSEQCNMINGTSGELWPPFMTRSSPVEFYSPDACRSIGLVFKRTGEFKGVPTYRYVAPTTLFANGTVYPPNEGFCPCRQSGILNVSSCRYNPDSFTAEGWVRRGPDLLYPKGLKARIQKWLQLLGPKGKRPPTWVTLTWKKPGMPIGNSFSLLFASLETPCKV